MTLKAYAPNGLEITHEYWLQAWAAPVEFEREEGLLWDSSDLTFKEADDD